MSNPVDIKKTLETLGVMNPEKYIDPPYKTTHAEFMKLMEGTMNELIATAKAGQKEYTKGEDEALSNFNRLADDLNLPREKVLWIFLKKHMDGVLSHINGHRSQREPVEGRIHDAIVYLLLLKAMIIEDRANNA